MASRDWLQRYLQQDDWMFDRLLDEAHEHSEDPLHRLLIFLKLFEQTQALFNEGT